MSTLFKVCITLFSLLPVLASALSRVGPVDSEYQVKVQESGLEHPVVFNGDTPTFIIPPPYPISDTSHTQMESKDRLAATMLSATTKLRSLFGSAMKKCGWDRRLDGQFLSDNYEKIHDCASEANEKYLRNYSALLNAYIETFRRHYAQTTETSLYHQQLSQYQMLFIPVTKQYWEVDSLAAQYRMLGHILKEIEFRKDADSPLGILAKDKEDQKKIESWLKSIERSERRYIEINAKTQNAFLCLKQLH